MIFYLAALQAIPPAREAAALEGASRWYFFRRVTFPLLMPTTLFVLVNAVINAFRLVDHIVVMTKGGPDNATALLLYYIYEVGFKFWDTAYAAALTVVLLCPGRGRPGAVPARSTGGCTTNERRATRRRARSPGWRRRGVAARRPLARCRCSTRSGPRSTRREFSTRFVLWRAADAARTSRRRGTPRPSPATSSTPSAGDHDPGRPARAVHARRLRLRALRRSAARDSRSCWCWCS